MITGISSLSGQQIIASGACSARSAATASYTTGGNDIQGLYTTVNSNSGNWNSPLFPSNITADSLYINNNGDITLLQQTGDDSDDYAQTVIHGSGIEFINGQIDPTVVGTIAGNDVSNWNSTYNTVSTNSASWTGGSVPDDITAHSLELTGNLSGPGNIHMEYHPIEAESDEIDHTTVTPGVIELVSAGTAIGTIDVDSINNWNDTVDTVSSNSSTWNTVTGKLDTTAQVVTATGSASVVVGFYPQYMVSSINGSAMLPYGFASLSSNSANWNSTYNTVSTNSASWTGGGTVGDYISAKGFQQHISNAAGDRFLSFWNEAGGSTATAYPAIYLSGQFGSAYYKDNELKLGRNGHSIAFNIGGQGPKISAGATGNIASFMYVYNTGASATIAQSSFNLSNSTASEDITIAKIQQWNSAYDQLGNVTALLDSL